MSGRGRVSELEREEERGVGELEREEEREEAGVSGRGRRGR